MTDAEFVRELTQPLSGMRNSRAGAGLPALRLSRNRARSRAGRKNLSLRQLRARYWENTGERPCLISLRA